MKNAFRISIFVFFSIVIMLFSSCVSFSPKENRYADYTYEQLIEKHGKTNSDNIFIVDNDVPLSFIAPDYSLYFSEDESKNGVQVRYLIWEKAFDNRVLAWLKIVNEQWIAFDSLEYNSRFVVF